MNLKQIFYLLLILILSCKAPTSNTHKDCAGIIGGTALIDNCGYCTEGTTNLLFNFFLGCDTACLGNQFDCNDVCDGEHIIGCDGVCARQDTAKIYDLCGDCMEISAPEWNENCKGCTNPNAACNSFDNTATVYEEGSCISPSYICDTGDDGLLDITTITDLTTDNEDCYVPADEYNCGPGTSICSFFDCNDPELELDETQSIPCNPQLTLDGYLVNESDIGNDTCDYYGIIDSTIYNLTSCPEFNYDGGTMEHNFTDGDCNLVDCRGVHFSNDLCEIELESIDIDASIESPDTSFSTIFIEGCIIGENREEIIYSSGEDNIIVAYGTTGWLRDGECDSEGSLLEYFGLDFNCIEYDFEGGDCYNLGRANARKKINMKANRLYKMSNKYLIK